MRVLLIITFVILTNSQFADAKGRCIVGGLSQTELTESEYFELKHEQDILIEESVSNFCRQNIQLRFLNTKIDFNEPNYKVKCKFSSSNIYTYESLVNTVRSELVYRDETSDSARAITAPWQSSLLSTYESRNSAIEKVEELASFAAPKRKSHKIPLFNSHNDNYKKLNEVLNGLTKYSDNINGYKLKNQMKEESGRLYLCNKYTSLKNVLSCSSAISLLQDKMSPLIYRNSHFRRYMIRDVDLWRSVFFHSQIEPLKSAVKNLVTDLKTALTKDKIEPQQNIFDDLELYLTKEGLTKQDATELTWNVLGLFGNTGSNLVLRLIEVNHSTLLTDFERNLSQLFTIGFGIDYNKANKNLSLYTIPQKINSSCDNTKSYHFWKSGFLTRYLLRKGYNNEVSLYAPYIASIGYQMKRSLVNGEVEQKRSILSYDQIDPLTTTIRSDLHFAAAGSLFAVNTNRIFKNSLDIAMIKSFKEVNYQKRVSSGELKRKNIVEQISIFESLYQPKKIFENVKSVLD